jgi:hypothetical protein
MTLQSSLTSGAAGQKPTTPIIELLTANEAAKIVPSENSDSHVSMV